MPTSSNPVTPFKERSITAPGALSVAAYTTTIIPWVGCVALILIRLLHYKNKSLKIKMPPIFGACSPPVPLVKLAVVKADILFIPSLNLTAAT